MPISMLDYALDYKARYGWNIIPVWWVRKNGMCGCGRSHEGDERSIGKHPIVPWKEWQNKEVPKEQLVEWWTKWPAASIAAITGACSNCACVDDDDKESEPGRFATLCAHTGSGGRHYYFKLNGPTLPCKSRIDDHTDFKCEAGYVILPPSSHAGGKHYVWDNDLPMADLPQEVKTLLNGHASTALVVAPKSDAVHTPGTRNDAMMREVCSLFGRGFSPKDVLEKIIEWNDEWNFPALSQDELVACVKSVWNNQERPKRAVQQQRRSRVEIPQGELNILSTYQMDALYGEKEQTWLIPGWLPTATCGIIGAPPETYKTWFMLDEALSIITGKPFLGKYPVGRTGNVLIIQQEDNYTALLERFNKIANLGECVRIGENEYAFPFRCPDEFLPKWDQSRSLHIENPVSMRQLETHIAEHRPVLVIVDPMFSFIPLADDYGVAAAQLINSKIKPLRDAYDVTFQFVHHTGKGAKKLEAAGGRQRDSLWGSTFLNAGLESAWNLRCETEGGTQIAVQRHTKVAGHEDDVQTDWLVTGWGVEVR